METELEIAQNYVRFEKDTKPKTVFDLVQNEMQKELRLEARRTAKEAIALVQEKIALESSRSLEKLQELQEYSNDQVAFQSAKLLLAYAIGQPVNRSINQNTTINIDVLAD